MKYKATIELIIEAESESEAFDKVPEYLALGVRTENVEIEIGER